ncbi:CAP domain-containing protein [Geodermatophilus sp. SYSU D01176]
MPAGPPLSSRIADALARWGRHLRLPRLVPLLLVVGAVAVVTVGAPMVSGAVQSFTDPVSLESATTSAGRATGSGGSWSSGGWANSGGSWSSDGSSSSGGSAAPAAPTDVDGDPAAQAPGQAPTASSDNPGAPVSPSVPATGTAPQSSAAAPDVEEPRREAGGPAAEVEAAPTPAPAAQAAAPADPSAEAAVLALVNEARAAAGCGALTADPALAAVARAHSADMRDRDYFSHTSPEGLSPFDRAEQAGIGYSRAENIAYGQADAAAVMEAWLESPGHRANILDCDLTKLGVGVAEGPGGPWWTQLFGA